MSGSRKQDAAHCSHAVTHSLQASIQPSYCLDGITFLLFCFVCFWISERRVHKISLLILRRGRLRNVPLSWMMGGDAPPPTDPAERCLSSHGRKSCLRVGRRARTNFVFTNSVLRTPSRSQLVLTVLLDTFSLQRDRGLFKTAQLEPRPISALW